MKYPILIMALAFSINCRADAYFELGAFYLENTFNRYSNSTSPDGEVASEYFSSGNTAAHLAVGYEFNFNSVNIDIQLKHQSDPNETGNNDLINNNALGIVARKYFR